MRNKDFTFTDIVEVPVIIVNNQVIQSLASMSTLPKEQLINIATTLGGQLSYAKMRITYSMLEAGEELCTNKGCFRPVDRSKNNHRCGDH